MAWGFPASAASVVSAVAGTPWPLGADGVLGGDGVLRSAGAAFPELFRLLPGAAPLSVLTRRTPRATDRAYRWVAGNRSRWGKLVTDAAKRRADTRIAARS